jgi:hypothetical protein
MSASDVSPRNRPGELTEMETHIIGVETQWKRGPQRTAERCVVNAARQRLTPV